MIGKRTAEGSTALFLTAFTLIYLFTGKFSMSIGFAVFAATIELLSTKIDDNFTIPVSVSLLAYAISML